MSELARPGPVHAAAVARGEATTGQNSGATPSHPVPVYGLTRTRSENLPDAPGGPSLARLQRHAQRRTEPVTTAPVIRRKLFGDDAVRKRAGEVAKTMDRGDVGNWSEAKTLLRAEEVSGGGGDADSNYFRAKREVDEAWAEYAKLTGGADPATLNWTLMDNGLSREEFDRAVAAAEQAFVRTLDTSRDLKTEVADLKTAFGGQGELLSAVDRASGEVSARKKTKEVFNVAATTATSVLLAPLTKITTLDELKAYCEHVVSIHGTSPLDTVRDYLLTKKRTLPIQASTSEQERIDTVAEVAARLGKAVGSSIPPQPIDANQRIPAMKKSNVGSAAMHAETLAIKGNPSRQLVLGVGRPGDPQGYQDFAKDYGVWDYESWGAWNKQTESTQFSNVSSDPGDAGGVDALMSAKDVSGSDVFDKLHFRLTGVFPAIPAAKDKLLAAIGLFQEMIDRGAEYYGEPINSLWTMGEINKIVFSPLVAKTAFYGQDGAEQNKALADLLPHTEQELKDLRTSKAADLRAIGDAVHQRLTTHYAGDAVKLKRAVARVAEQYYNLPRGADWVVADITKAIT